MTVATKILPEVTSPPARLGFNVRLFAISCALLLLSGVSAYFWHQRQLNGLADAFLNRATQLEEKQDWNQAASYVHRYLQVHPEDGDAKVRLAQVYDKTVTSVAHRGRAIELYYQASLSASPEKANEVKTRLAQLLVETGRFDEGLAVSNEVLAQTPGDAAALKWKALALYRKFDAGQTDRSPKTLQITWDALQLGVKSNSDDLLMCATVATAIRKSPELLGQAKKSKQEVNEIADQYLDDLVARKSKDADVLLGRYAYRRQFSLPGAQEDLAAAVANAGTNQQVVLVAAEDAYTTAVASNLEPDRERALQLLAKANEIVPGYAGAYLQRGNLLAMGKDVDNAIATWQAGITKAPRDTMELRIALARTLALQGDFQEAEDSLRELDKELKGFKSQISSDTRQRLQASISLWRGTLAFRQGDLKKAESELKPATLRKTADTLEVESVVHAWLLLGEIYGKWQHWDRAALAFEAALQQTPGLADAQLAAVRSWRAAGRPDRAADQLKRLVNDGPTAEKYLMLAENSLDMQRLADVDDRQWQDFDHATTQAKRLGGDDWDRLWEIKILEAQCSLMQALSGDDANAQGHLAKGMSFLAEVENRYADQPGCLRRLAIIYEASSRIQEADRVRNRLATNESLGVDSILTQAEIALRRGDVTGAVKTVQDALGRAGIAERPALQAALDRLALLNSDPKQAYADLERAFSKDPQNLPLLRRLAESGVARAAWGELEQKWEPLLVKLQGDGSPDWLFFRSVRLISQAKSAKDSKLKEAQTLVDRLKLARPQWSSSFVAQAQLSLRQGDVSSAITNFKEALNAGDMRLAVHQTLLQLLRSERRFEEADALLASIRQKSAVTNPVLDSLELSLAAEMGQFSRGVDLARMAVEARPNDPSAHQWLGEMLLLSNELLEAEKSFKQATVLKPDQAANWVALFQYYVRTKQATLAVKALESLKAHSSLTEGQKTFALAQGYEVLQDFEQATKLYKAAEKLNPQNPNVLLRIARYYQNRDPDAAIELLRRVNKLSPESRESLRLLIILLASRGEDSDWSEIDRLWTTDPTVADLRLKAVLTLRRPGQDFRGSLDRARQLLDQVVQSEGRASDETRRLIVQLSLRQAAIASTAEQRKLRLAECHEQLRALATQDKASAASVSQYIDFLLRYESPQKVLGWVRKLSEAEEKRDIGSHARLIRYLSQRHLHEDSIRELTRFAESVTSLEGDEASLGAKAYVALCIQTKLTKQAKPHLERLMSDSAEDAEVVALQVTLSHAEKDTTSALNAIQAYQRRMEPKATQKDQQVQLAIQLGQLYSMVELHNEALQCYRRAYDANPQAVNILLPALVRANDLDEALRLCDASLAKSKSPAQLVSVLQSLLAKSDGWKDATRAEGLIQSALQAFPSDMSLKISVAILRTLQDKPQDAVRLYREALAKDPQNLIALNNLAVVLAEVDPKNPEAIELVDRAIVLGGANGTVLDSKGLVCLLKKDVATAKALLTAAAAPPNTDPRHHLHLAAALATDERQASAATRELNAAMKLDVEKYPLSKSERQMVDTLRKQLSPQQARSHGAAPLQPTIPPTDSPIYSAQLTTN